MESLPRENQLKMMLGLPAREQEEDGSLENEELENIVVQIKQLNLVQLEALEQHFVETTPKAQYFSGPRVTD